MKSSKQILSVMFAAFLAACSSPDRSENETDTKLSNVAPLAEVSESEIQSVATAKQSGDANRVVKKLIQRVNYINPVNKNDVMMETTMIIEAKSGDINLREGIDTCYEKLSVEGAKPASVSPRISTLVDTYFLKEEFAAETLSKISQLGSTVLQNCESDYMKECPGECDNYLAAAIVISSMNQKSNRVLEKNIDYESYVPTEEGPKP